MVLGKMLQVLVVGSDDGPGLALPKLLQHGLGDGAADLRLRARTKLVDEDQRAVVGLADHPLHAQQVGGVGAQVVLQALLVADVHHDVVEEARLGTIAHGDGEAHLEHVLEQADRLQAHRLAARVGSGDDQNAALARQRDLQGDDALRPAVSRLVVLLCGGSRLGQRALQQRVARLDPVYDGGVGYVGRRGPHRLGQLVLGLDEVDLGEEVVAVDDLGHMGAHALGVGGEDADDLLALLVLEVADLVVGLDDLGRFDVERAA